MHPCLTHAPSADHSVTARSITNTTGQLARPIVMSAAQLQALPHAPLPWPQMRMTCQSACSCGRRASTALAVASCRAVQPGGSLNSACISPAASIRSSRCAWHHCQPLRSRASPARLATTADGSSHAATAQHTAAPLPADCCGTAGRPHQPHSRLSRLSQSEAGQASRRTLLTGLAAAQLAALQHPQVSSTIASACCGTALAILLRQHICRRKASAYKFWGSTSVSQ